MPQGKKLLAAALISAAPMLAQWGIFEGHGDIGAVLHRGSVHYDAAAKIHRIAASGENMWGSSDAFHFVWMKASGDFSIAADIVFATSGGNPHKKAVLMIRQNLEAGSAYAGAALHAGGLTSLQARDMASSSTSTRSAPA